MAPWYRHLRHPHLPAWTAGLAAALWVLLQLDQPLVEDGLFWWVPKGLLAAEKGFRVVLAHELPESIARHLDDGSMPAQWAGGLPDYAHPPLWYWWLALFLKVSPTVQAVHLACLLPAVLAASGFAALGARLGHRWSGLAALALPPLLAQLLRPDLDLPLLAITPWALLALVDQRWSHFLVLGLLAPWLKEPGVLLVAPAIWAALRERRWRWQALAPLAGLALWAWASGRLATPERLPTDAVTWAEDVVVAAKIVLIQQGRWLLLLAAPLAFLRARSPGREVALLMGLTWLVFFATVGFFATRGGLEGLTHVRYFVPGMATLVVLFAARWPWIGLVGLIWVAERSPYGPEASLFGLHAARAEQAAAPWIAASDARIWVGSYQAAGLTQPWAGVVDTPVVGLHTYGEATEPSELGVGDVVLIAAYGEPAGRLQRELTLSEIQAWTVGAATVRAYRVIAHRPEASRARRQPRE